MGTGALVVLLGACDNAGSHAAALDGSGGSGAGAIPDVSECEPPDPALAETDAEELFDYPHVPTFDFYLPQPEWEALQRNARDEQYTMADACFEGRRIGSVGLRFKGSYGSLFECFDEHDEQTCARLSMKVKFSEYDDEQRFFGLKRLNFHAYHHDDSRLKERLSFDLFRSMGIVAPRASWAVLRVNGQLQGLYGMVEQIDGRFTTDRFPDNPDANLYKELWPTEIDETEATLALKTNDEEPDVSSFVAFAEAMDAASEEDLPAVLGDHMDLRYVARFLAVEDALASYDGVTYFWTDGVESNNHNYYIYEHVSDRFTLIPWDLEATFWINPDHATPHWTELPEDCDLTYEYWSGLAKAPACNRVFRAMLSDLDEWREAGQELLDGPFSVKNMSAAIDRHAAFIGEAAHADPTPPTYTSFDNAVAGLKIVVPDLRERLERLIAKE